MAQCLTQVELEANAFKRPRVTRVTVHARGCLLV